MNFGETVLVLIVAGAAILSRAADGDIFTISFEKKELDYNGYPTNSMVAEEKGRADARLDVSKGVFRVPTYGLPGPSSDKYFRILEKRFGIQRQTLGGCSVSEGLVSYAKGYSEISLAAIRARFGTNILEQTWREVERGEGKPSGPTMSPVARGLETHRIRPGETLTTIAKQHSVSLDQLMEINPRVSPNRLQTDQLLILPARTRAN